MIDSDFIAHAPAAWRQAHRGARQRIGDHHEAEDVAQEAMLRAWRRRGELDGAEHLTNFARSAARFIAWDRLRSTKVAKMTETGHDEDGPVVVIQTRDDLAGFVRAALETVPEYARQDATLYYGHGQSIATIAAVGGATEAAVKMRLHKARLAMRERMGGA